MLSQTSSSTSDPDTPPPMPPDSPPESPRAGGPLMPGDFPEGSDPNTTPPHYGFSHGFTRFSKDATDPRDLMATQLFRWETDAAEEKEAAEAAGLRSGGSPRQLSEDELSEDERALAVYHVAEAMPSAISRRPAESRPDALPPAPAPQPVAARQVAVDRDVPQPAPVAVDDPGPGMRLAPRARPTSLGGIGAVPEGWIYPDALPPAPAPQPVAARQVAVDRDVPQPAPVAVDDPGPGMRLAPRARPTSLGGIGPVPEWWVYPDALPPAPAPQPAPQPEQQPEQQPAPQPAAEAAGMMGGGRRKKRKRKSVKRKQSKKRTYKKRTYKRRTYKRRTYKKRKTYRRRN